MKLTKKRLRQYVKQEIRTAEKRNTSLIESQLKGIQEAIDVVVEENKLDLREHFLEHQNNIFLPILDEATGEKTYESKNLDEYLTEFRNNYNLYDEVFQRLEESIDYERSLYFEENENDVLSEVDWTGLAQKGKEKVKGAVEKGKEKVKGAIEKVKSAYKKGALYFFLKTVQMGLKAALAASKGIFGLLKKLMIKAVLKAIKSWRKGKKKVKDVFEDVKQGALKGGFMKIMKKMPRPFMWIAGKLSKDVEKQKELAPIIMSICMSCALLAFMWAMGGMNIFGEATSGMGKAMTEATTEMGAEEAAMMCLAEGINYKNRDPRKQLLLEGCGIILESGEEMSNEMAKAVMKDLLEKDIVGKLDQATTTISTQVQDVVNNKLVQSVDTYTGYAKTSFDQSQEVINLMQGAIRGGKGMAVDLSESGWSDHIKKTIGGSIARVTAAAGDAVPEVSDAELDAVAKGIVWTHHVDSVVETLDSEHVVNDVLVKSREYIKAVGKQTVTAVDTGGLTDTAATAAKGAVKGAAKGVAAHGMKDFLPENILSDKEVLRFKKLGGLLKS